MQIFKNNVTLKLIQKRAEAGIKKSIKKCIKSNIENINELIWNASGRGETSIGYDIYYAVSIREKENRNIIKDEVKSYYQSKGFKVKSDKTAFYECIISWEEDN